MWSRHLPPNELDMILRREHLAVLGIAVSLAACARPSYARWSASDVPLGPATRPSDSATTIAVAPPGTEWTVVTPAEWKTRSRQLVGKYVEVFGGMRTQLLISRKSSFGNAGSLIDSTDTEVGQVLFDQAADEVISWIRKAKCAVGCLNVFIRGMVVEVPTPSGRSKDIELRVIEVSNESKTGTPVAGSAALAMLSATDPDAKKPLLPLGAVPGKGGSVPPGGASAMPPDTAAKKGRLMRWLKAAGVMVQPGTPATGRAAPQEGVFHFGDRSVTETAYRNIRDTELYKIFANAPWNGSYTMWPRVAIIIEGHQQGGTNDLSYTKLGDEVKNGSWRLRAKIWTGPAASRDVAPFNWCLSEMHYDTLSDNTGATYLRVAFMDLPLWGTTPKTMMSDQNTGSKVTTGPNPPYVPAAKFEYRGPSQADVIMLGNLMRDMDFSFGVPDGRVWIVDASQP